LFRIAASLLWQPATGFVGTQFRLVHREPRARQALVTNHRMCQHNKPRACMHIIASLKGFRLQTHADEGMPVASRAVQVRIYRCTHDHDSQLAHALAPAVKVCRRSGMMQINASCQSCAKRPSALCPVAGSPSQVCPNRSICGRTGSAAALPASVRASYFACLMSVRFCVHSTGRTPRAGHSGSPQRPSDLDRETVRQWNFGGTGCDPRFSRKSRAAGHVIKRTHGRLQRRSARRWYQTSSFAGGHARSLRGRVPTASVWKLGQTAPKCFAIGPAESWRRSCSRSCCLDPPGRAPAAREGLPTFFAIPTDLRSEWPMRTF